MATIDRPDDGDFFTETWVHQVADRLNTGFCYEDDAASQSIADSAITASPTGLTLAAASVQSDPGAWFDDANDRVVIPEDGVYDIDAWVGWANNGTGQRRFLLRKNGSAKEWVLGGGANAGWGQNISCKLKLVAGDNLSLAVVQNSGGALNVTGKHLGIRRAW